MALGACSGMDVVSILKKKRLEIEGFEVILRAERAEEHPKVFKKIRLTYLFRGAGLPLKALEDAVRLSQEKYCSVAGMLKPSVELEYDIQIESGGET